MSADARKFVLASVAILGAAFVGFVGLAVWHLIAGQDPLDRFEVIAVEAIPGTRKHAVTYRYHHANSSSTMSAMWQLSAPPFIGSNSQPPPDSTPPMLIWFEARDMLERRWVDGRLRIVVSQGVALSADQPQDCYFNGQTIPWARRICFASRSVTVGAAHPAK